MCGVCLCGVVCVVLVCLTGGAVFPFLFLFCFIVVGVLKGYDQLTNLVLDNTVEMVRDTLDAYKLTDETRAIGLSVVRGTSVLTIASTDNEEEIANPFAQEVEEQNIG